MKLKKTMTTFLALVMTAGMILPQTVSPLGTAIVYAEEADISGGENALEETESADDLTLDLLADEEETASAVQVTSEEELTAALAAASTDADNPTVIELQNDLSLTGYLTIASGTYVEIQSADGQQFTLKAGDDTASSAYFVKRNYNGVLYVCGSLSLKNVICDANRLTRGAIVPSGGMLELGDGAVLTHGNPTYVSGSKADYSMGGGVYVWAGATLIMDKGSAVRDNTVSLSSSGAGNPSGIGVYVAGASSTSHGTFYMYGGTISGNEFVYKSSIVYGGGLCLGNYVDFYMYGGTISGNEITGSGAGIYAYTGSTAVIGRTEETEIADLSVCDDKVLISDNTITDDVGTGVGTGSMPQGAGIAVLGKLTIQAADDADTVISGNTVYNNTYKYPETTGSGVPTPSYRGCGGGLFVTGSTASVTMTGGTISGNRAICEYEPTEDDDEDLAAYHYANGGGVYVQEGAFTMTGGQITGNSASSAWAENPYAGVGGGLCVAYNAGSSDVTVTLTGGTISGNTAAAGSDVYLTNAIPSYQGGNSGPGGTSYSDGYVLYSASDLLYVGGSVQIGELYLPAEVEEPYNTGATGLAALHMVSALSNENAIGVDVEDPQVGTVIVEKEEDGYAPGTSDEAAFCYTGSAEDLEIRLDSDSNLSLQSRTETASLADAAVAFAEADQAISYSGEKLTPEPTVTLEGQTLEKGTDYVLSYKDNVNVGTATVVVSGIGAYTGSVEASFTITALDISDAEAVTVDAIGSQAYTGNALEPAVAVYLNGNALTRGEADSEDSYDYSVAYTDNTALGTATVTITGHGNFTGTRTVSFDIVDVEGTTVVTDGVSLEQAIESASGTTAEDPLIISLTADVTLAVTDATDAAAATDAMITLPENTYVQILGYGHAITLETDGFATEEQPVTGMFIVTAGSSLTLDRLTLDGAYHERLLYVAEDGEATVNEDVTLTRGRATEISGGSTSLLSVIGGQAIWNAGVLTLAGSLSENRTTSNYYGAVYNETTGSITMTDTARIENIRINTGAVYNAGTFTMDGGVITESSVPVGSNSSGKAVYNVGTFTMKDGSAITENTGVSSTVYNAGTFLMEGGEITLNDNSSFYGMNEEAGTFQMTGGVFTMTGGTISGNAVANKGGGLYIVDGVVTINGEDAEISGNSAVNTVTDQASTMAIGGGIYMRGGELNILNGSVDNNEAYYGGTENRYKQARLGQVYSLDGTYSIVTSSSSSNAYQYYGLGGGIFVDSGILTIGDGAVIENNYCPIDAASGVVIAEDLVNTVEDWAAQIYLYGNAQVSDTIWLDTGKSIHITGALGADVSCQVYQQKDDFQLVENGGTAVAIYDDESYMDKANDGAKFTVYPYDAEFDFETDGTLDRYTALDPDDSWKTYAGIFANYATIDISELEYVFTDAYSTDDETGIAQYKYNGRTVRPSIEATVQVAVQDGEGTVAMDATDDLIFKVATNDGSVGDCSVTVTSDSYHYTDNSGAGYVLTFRIIPFDLSNPDESNVYEAVEFTAEDVSFPDGYPTGTLCETTVTGQVRLGSVSWTTLVQAESADSETGDYVVTYENNDRPGVATAVITGINNYSGEVRVTFTITGNGEEEEPEEPVVAEGSDTLGLRSGKAFSISYTLGGEEDIAFTLGKSTDEILIGDWDGDGYDSICLRRGATYYVTNTLGGEVEYSFTFGKSTDEILVGDWDGDGCDTLCIRRGNQYTIYNTLGNSEAAESFRFGKSTDEVFAGDWDGDGCDTLCIRRGNSYYMNNTLEGGNAVEEFDFGKSTDEILAGDWDGDGCDTLCIRRGNVYYINNTLEGGYAELSFTYGEASDEVFAGCWDTTTQAEEPDTIGLRRGSSFMISYELGGEADMTFTLGKSTDEILIGDWDGDGYDSICLRRGATYYVTNTLGGEVEYSFTFGKSTDEILVGDWDGDGVDTLCVRRGNQYTIYNTLGDSEAAESFRFGKSTDEVFAGDWDGDGYDTLCIRRGNSYYMNNTLEGGNAATEFDFGRSTDEILAGDWDGDGCDTLCIRRGNVYYINNTLEGGYAELSFKYGKSSDEALVGTWNSEQ